jgi:hypothetical protein
MKADGAKRVAKIVERSARRIRQAEEKGGVLEGSLAYRPANMAEPKERPGCPRCGVETRWRGPHPEVNWRSGRAWSSSLPLSTITSGSLSYVCAEAPTPGETRRESADRLYGIADRHKGGAAPTCAAGIVLWQAALCDTCDTQHRLQWLEAVYPEGPSVSAGVPF